MRPIQLTMSKYTRQICVGFGCILLCYMTSYYFYELSTLGTNFDRGAVKQNNIYRWTSLADLFVVRGQKYKENDGVIYDCLTGDVFETVPKLKVVRNFTTVLTEKSQDSSQRQTAFQHIFDNRLWMSKQDKNSNHDKVSPEYRASGTGSTLQASQAPLALLNVLVERLKIYLNKPVITIVDIPCGDFYWMKELVGQRSDVKYTGIDIVPTLITGHQKNYGNMKNARFMHMDIVQSRLNESYDIIFCRDMLQHLKNTDVMQALDHFSSSGSKLLVTTQKKITQNTDIANGGYRHLNLTASPVNLVPPVCIIPDKVDRGSIRYLATWILPLKQGDI